MYRMKNFSFIAFAILMLVCCCAREVRETPRPQAQEPVRQEAPAPVVRYNSCNDPCSLIRLSTEADNDAAMGQPYGSTATLTALADAFNVCVIGKTPDGTTYLKSEPAATVEGSKLTWNFDYLKKDSVVPLKVWFRADREGQVVSCFTFTALPAWCAPTNVGRASLVIVKTGPALAALGSTISYTIRVTNSGSAMAREIVVTDQLPEGLNHESGQRTITFPAFDLEPGASRELTVTVTAAQRGRFCNTATAASSNAGTASAEACTVVQQQSLDLVVTCQKELFLGHSAKSGIILKNPGDTKLTNVVVTAEFPTALKFLGSDCGFEKGADGTSAVWNIGDLDANSEKACEIQTISKAAGEVCLKVSVSTAEGISKSESCCTNWRGFAALLLEVVDDPDPLLIATAEETVYTIRVTNQGTAADRDINIRGVVPPELEAVSIQGSTEGTINGKEFTFAPYPVLAPKQVIEWKMNCKAVKVGDARIKFFLTSELLKTPNVEEEPTQVY